MKTALEKVLETMGHLDSESRYWLALHFEYGAFRVHVFHPIGSRIWNTQTGRAWRIPGKTPAEILDAVHPDSGKTVRTMLLELPETAVRVWTAPEREGDWPSVPLPASRMSGAVPLPPRTALDVVLAAANLDNRGKKYVETIEFLYEDVSFRYCGHYYGYTYAAGDSDECEAAGDSFYALLAAVPENTGKAIWQMLEELPPDAVTVEFDPDWPTAPLVEETE